MSELVHDLRHGLRTLRKRPGFTLVAVLILALGIGANTIVFTLVNAVLLRPLPYEESDSLYGLLERNPELGDAGYRAASYPTFLDWHGQSDVFDGLAYAHGTELTYRGPEGPELVAVAFVTEEFLPTMRTRPLLGRTLAPSAEQGGDAFELVVSHRLWNRRFGGDASVLGRSITLGRASFTIVGVMPAGFRFPDWAEAWVPITAFEPTGGPSILHQRGFHADSRLIARLRPDVPRVRAEEQMDAIARRLAGAYPAENAGWTSVFWWPIEGQILDQTTAPRLASLMAAVGLVLLIACVNLANLSLTQVLRRSREMAVRTALGATRARLARQVLAEGLVLGLVGCGLGVALAWWGVKVIRATVPLGIVPRIDEVSVDTWVLGFAVAASLLTVLGFGLTPALRAGVADLGSALKSGARDLGTSRAGGRLRAGFLAIQLALTVVVLAGAGLLAKSLWRLTRVELGYDPHRVIGLRVTAEKYGPDETFPFFERLVESIAAVPGVESVGYANFAPMSRAGIPGRVVPEGQAPDPRSDQSAWFRVVSPDFFETLGIAVLQGRGITAADVQSPGNPVVVVNQSLARRYWPGESPIGRRVSLVRMSQGRADFGQPFSAAVVGVSGNVRLRHEIEPEPEIYLPFSVNPWQWAALAIRTRGDPEHLVPQLRRAVLAVDPELPVGGDPPSRGFVSMTDRLDFDVASQRFSTGVFVAFAVTALLLGVVGVYGVTANLASQRRAEIGLRMALGAARTDVVRLVVRHGMLPVMVGGVVGLAAALALTRLIRALLFGVRPTDLATFMLVTLVLCAAALLASYLPARHAAGVDPVEALRHE